MSLKLSQFFSLLVLGANLSIGFAIVTAQGSPRFEDYSDFEDLLTLAEESVRQSPLKKQWFWHGESRGKKVAKVANAVRQFGVINFGEEPSRKRRSEGRLQSASVLSERMVPFSVVRSGRIFPSPRIVQRFQPLKDAPPKEDQIRVEASSVPDEFPEWLALHAGGRPVIRARSYRELLLHALERAQAELSRRHRLLGPGRTLVDGEAAEKQKKAKVAFQGFPTCLELCPSQLTSRNTGGTPKSQHCCQLVEAPLGKVRTGQSKPKAGGKIMEKAGRKTTQKEPPADNSSNKAKAIKDKKMDRSAASRKTGGTNDG